MDSYHEYRIVNPHIKEVRDPFGEGDASLVVELSDGTIMHASAAWLKVFAQDILERVRLAEDKRHPLLPMDCAGSEMPVDLLSRVRKGWAGDAA